MTPLYQWSARHRDLYLTTHNTHNRQTSIGLLCTSDQSVAETSTWQHTTLTTGRHTSVGFEPTVSAGERPQTHALDRAATGTGQFCPLSDNSVLQNTRHSVTYFSSSSGTNVCTVVPLRTVAWPRLIWDLCNGSSFRTFGSQSTQSSQITTSLTNIFPFLHKTSSDEQNTNINHRNKMLICWQKYK